MVQLLFVSRARQRGAPDVVAQVEVGVVHPHRPSLVQRDEGKSLSVARHEVKAQLDRLDQLVIAPRLAREHRAARHVHVRRVALEVQKRAVEPGQPVLVRHRLDGRPDWTSGPGPLARDGLDPADLHAADLDLGPGFEHTEKVPGEAPYVRTLFNYTFGCLLSLGFGHKQGGL